MKNKITAGILAAFVGLLGVHRFYLNQVGLGLLYLFFCWTPIVWVVVFIDFIVFLTMNDNVFDAKYNNTYNAPNQQRQQHQQQQQSYGSRPTYEGRPTYNKYKPEYQQNRQYNNQQQTRNQGSREQPKSNPYKDEGTRLYREYDFKGAIKNYQQSLRINPTDPIVHFNLACLFSLEEEPSHAFMHLSKAVEYGFVMYDKIRTHDHLAFLRTQTEFDVFVANGYKMQKVSPMLPPRQKDEIDLMSDEVMNKLERLASLRDKGILTEAEFQKQKSKILKL